MALARNIQGDETIGNSVRTITRDGHVNSAEPLRALVPPEASDAERGICPQLRQDEAPLRGGVKVHGHLCKYV